MLIDTHCHLDFPEFNADREQVIQRSKEQGVGFIINIGSSLQGSESAVALAKQSEIIYATVGLHPHEADTFNKEIEADLISLAKNDKVVAIGEIGLDYYKNYSKPKNQRKAFLSLLKAAGSLGLPLVIHTRCAEADTLSILKDSLPVRTVVHCFSGDINFLNDCLGLGFLVSFTCNITYKKAQNLRDLVKIAPLDRIMLETDAPFLAPEGLRGRRNEPAYVKILAEEIARIKGISFQEVASATTLNAKSFFGLGL